MKFEGRLDTGPVKSHPIWCTSTTSPNLNRTIYFFLVQIVFQGLLSRARQQWTEVPDMMKQNKQNFFYWKRNFPFHYCVNFFTVFPFHYRLIHYFLIDFQLFLFIICISVICMFINCSCCCVLVYLPCTVLKQKNLNLTHIWQSFIPTNQYKDIFLI